MYSTYNEFKSVFVEKFIRTLKDKIYKNEKMIVRNSRSYLDYLDELLDEYSKTYHGSIGKKPIDASDSGLTEKF